MRTIIAAVSLLMLAACGSGSGSSGAPVAINQPSPVIPIATTCKSINSVWQSLANHERHDLTNLPAQDAHTANYDNTTWQSYAFMAGTTGERCPANGQPQSAILVTQVDAQAIAAGFQSLMYLHNNHPSVACSTYQNAGQSSDGSTTGAIYAKRECNKLTLCRLYGDVSTCTVFN